MDFLHQLAVSLSPEILNLLAVAFCLVLLIVVGLIARLIGKSEKIKQYDGILKAIAANVADLIIFAKYGEEYKLKADYYEQKQRERELAGDYYVDARMLYVLDKVEIFAFDKFGVHVEFDDILPLAEAKYNKLRQDGYLGDEPLGTDDTAK